MSRDLAIDLGTANTLVYAKGRGIVLNEPTVVALDTRSRDVLAIGDDAWQMIGRTPGYIVAVRPLRQGAITDFEITERMLQVLLRRVGVGRMNRPRVLICVPSAITAVERRAVKEAARRAGASSCYLIEQPMAAAIGAGLPIHEPVGSMIVDVGGGTSETAVISLGGVVTMRAIRCGGFDLDAAIQSYVRAKFGIAIGERTAEEVKIEIGTALPLERELLHVVQELLRHRVAVLQRHPVVLLVGHGVEGRIAQALLPLLGAHHDGGGVDGTQGSVWEEAVVEVGQSVEEGGEIAGVVPARDLLPLILGPGPLEP